MNYTLFIKRALPFISHARGQGEGQVWDFVAKRGPTVSSGDVGRQMMIDRCIKASLCGCLAPLRSCWKRKIVEN